MCNIHTFLLMEAIVAGGLPSQGAAINRAGKNMVHTTMNGKIPARDQSSQWRSQDFWSVLTRAKEARCIFVHPRSKDVQTSFEKGILEWGQTPSSPDSAFWS